ncbi:unnamed protein product [Absidia cylindrospora]
MAFLNKLMDNKKKSTITSSPSSSSSHNQQQQQQSPTPAPAPSSTASSPFPSVSSLLHKPIPSTTTSSSALPTSLAHNVGGCTPMSVDSTSSNKRGMPWQELERENKLPRRLADTITNDFAHQVNVSDGQVTPSHSTSTINSQHSTNNATTMDYTKQPLPQVPGSLPSIITTASSSSKPQQSTNTNNNNNSYSSRYTSVYNDQVILQHRQNRPQLKLADFHIMRTLGTGSFGRVHLIQSRVNARHYAMKVLKKTEVVRLKQVEHTNNEKHILESTGHPFLINCWGTFQDTTNLYMVMDYVAGGELFSVLRRSQRFPDHVAKFYAGEVLLAIEYLHSKDIIYRDLKPENLLLDNQGHVKITDFGFAKYVPDITWTLCGTPDYLAPEVIQSKGYGKAVDWWSLGVLIYEMLAGQPPFYDDDHLKLYEKILAGKIRWPTYFDQAAISLLRKLLTSDLSKRYGNLKAGSEDIKRHAWFEGVDFNMMLAKQIRAPYIPTIRSDGDASHFDKYPETNEQYGVMGLDDPYKHLFLSF